MPSRVQSGFRSRAVNVYLAFMAGRLPLDVAGFLSPKTRRQKPVAAALEEVAAIISTGLPAERSAQRRLKVLLQALSVSLHVPGPDEFAAAVAGHVRLVKPCSLEAGPGRIRW